MYCFSWSIDEKSLPSKPLRPFSTMLTESGKNCIWMSSLFWSWKLYCYCQIIFSLLPVIQEVLWKEEYVFCNKKKKSRDFYNIQGKPGDIQKNTYLASLQTVFSQKVIMNKYPGPLGNFTQSVVAIIAFLFQSYLMLLRRYTLINGNHSNSLFPPPVSLLLLFSYTHRHRIPSMCACTHTHTLQDSS